MTARRRRGGGGGGEDGTAKIKPDSTKDVFHTFAEKVRDNKHLESRWAILQETRVEYFRGKDFIVFLRNHPEVKQTLASDKDLEAEDIINTLLRKNLLIRCDRLVKTVRPGKKKLSSWPAHLKIHSEQAFSESDGFFAWTFMKRTSLWQTILSFLWPLVALAMCLFPIYPYQCKIFVLYTCAGALLFIGMLLLLRGAIFCVIWIILGKRVWFFPNITEEETTIRELVRFWPNKDEGEPPKWTSRVAFAIVSVLFILLLRHHAPNEAARARYQKKVFNVIDDVLEWSPKQALSGMMEKQQNPLFNETETNHTVDASNASEIEESIENITMEVESTITANDDIGKGGNGERTLISVEKWIHLILLHHGPSFLCNNRQHLEGVLLMI